MQLLFVWSTIYNSVLANSLEVIGYFYLLQLIIYCFLQSVSTIYPLP